MAQLTLPLVQSKRRHRIKSRPRRNLLPNLLLKQRWPSSGSSRERSWVRAPCRTHLLLINSPKKERSSRQAAADYRLPACAPQNLFAASSFTVRSRRLAAHCCPFAAAQLNQQFVRENTQAIKRCGFDSKNDGTECDRLTAMAPRERKF